VRPGEHWFEGLFGCSLTESTIKDDVLGAVFVNAEPRRSNRPPPTDLGGGGGRLQSTCNQLP
jgi:hypothetical protein